MFPSVYVCIKKSSPWLEVGSSHETGEDRETNVVWSLRRKALGTVCVQVCARVSLRVQRQGQAGGSKCTEAELLVMFVGWVEKQLAGNTAWQMPALWPTLAIPLAEQLRRGGGEKDNIK